MLGESRDLLFMSLYHLINCAVAQQISSAIAAVRMLSERLHVLTAYLVAVKRGELPVDHDLLRKVASVAYKVPVTGDPELLIQLNKVCTLMLDVLAGIGVCSALRE